MDHTSCTTCNNTHIYLNQSTPLPTSKAHSMALCTWIPITSGIQSRIQSIIRSSFSLGYSLAFSLGYSLEFTPASVKNSVQLQSRIQSRIQSSFSVGYSLASSLGYSPASVYYFSVASVYNFSLASSLGYSLEFSRCRLNHIYQTLNILMSAHECTYTMKKQ